MNNLYTANDPRSHRFFKIQIKDRKLTKYNNVIQLEVSLITKKGFDKV